MSYKISTITMSLNIPNCNLNLINIGKYLEIDENILGIKFFFGKMSILKGKYNTSIYKKSKLKNFNKINKRLFYNQISIIINLPNINEQVNLKLFNNGSISLTGLKNDTNSTHILLFLYNKLLLLIDKNDTILLVKDEHNIYLDSNNNIYTQDEPHFLIGYKHIENNIGLYNINKKNYIINIKNNKSYFISTIFQTKKTKEILDLNGKYIGYTKIELLKNHKKLYKSPYIKFDNNSNLIYYENILTKSSNVIGNITYNYTNTKINNKINDEINDEINLWKIIEYSCNPFINLIIIKDINILKQTLISDINSINIYFKILFELNRTRLFNELLKYNYLCEYKPEKYTGVKLRFKINSNYKLDSNNGICLCNIKCTCKTITFLIFQSGNVIVSGFKNIKDINNIYNYFIEFMDKIKNVIVKKKLII